MQTMPTAVTKPARARSELTQGWRPLLGAVALYGGSPIILLQTGGLFIQPIREATGLPVSVIAIAPIVTLMLALAQPAVGALMERTGTRPLAIGALCTMVAGLIALAALPASEATFLTVAILIGLGGSLGFTATTAKYLSQWFRKNFGLAFGIVGGAASLIPLLAIPLITPAIYSSGWRAGYWVLTGFVALISLPIVLWGFREPKTALFDDSVAGENQKGSSPTEQSASYRYVLTDARFWVLMLSIALVTLALGGFIAHLQPMLLMSGIPVGTATTMTMAILMGVLTGRILGGFLLDRIWPYLVPIIVLTAAAIAAFTLTTSASTLAVPLLLVTVFTIGMAQGAEADFPAFFLLREFGPKRFAVISGYAFLIAGVCASLGGITFSALRDLTGNYTIAGYLGAAFYGGGMVLMVVVGALSRRAARQGKPVYIGHKAK
ncbi:MFS transporter [Paenarthrobacter aromaticivorans]|uniref:MFS transporter n=1 Tax=Paenarthrobacter aromaticivorans TaxID=2849150 RepID=A0ABS6IAQ0_9MICC|nr:MFS transporter [Paenarthrobacter sp. MMS21-TAE1-1]MBU8868495.1 MFS transporter [Paenarthrobacter sp. MMS21-TAE1-1]